MFTRVERMDRTPCGSATHTPHFDQSYDTPPHIRWSQDFHYLIKDDEGIQLFTRYLESEGLKGWLDFWFACEGLKSDEPNESKAKKIIEVIYKKYIRNSNAIELSDEVRHQLKDKWVALQHITSDRKSDRNIFDLAQNEVEEQLKSAIYINFLRSDLYLNYIQSNGFNSQYLGATGGSGGYDESSPKDSVLTNSSISPLESSLYDNNPRTQSTQCYDHLPTVDEESELQTINTLNKRINSEINQNRSQTLNKFQSLPLDVHYNPMSSISSEALREGLNKVINKKSVSTKSTSASRLTTEMHPSNRVSHTHKSYFPNKSKADPPHPYHVLYAPFLPTSARDSELQSQSSHSTNESMSCVSAGHNGNDNTIRSKKQMNNAIKRNAKLNSSADSKNPNPELLGGPRTQKMAPSISATNDPEKFAQALIERLEQMKKYVDSEENNNKKMAEVLRGFKDGSNTVSHPSVSNPSDETNRKPIESLKDLLSKNQLKFVDEENYQSILDQHFAQVFAETPNETPTDSIGKLQCVSPPKHSYLFYENRQPMTTTSASAVSSAPVSQTYDVSQVVVTIRYTTETMPYRLNLSGPHITLRKFKQQIPTKRGNWQYFFKRKCDDIDISAPYVLEKITDDNVLLPLIDGKIFAEIQPQE